MRRSNEEGEGREEEEAEPEPVGEAIEERRVWRSAEEKEGVSDAEAESSRAEKRVKNLMTRERICLRKYWMGEVGR
jgi:hypothetical protein